MLNSSTLRASAGSAIANNAWFARLAWSLGSLLVFLLVWDVAANIIDHRHLPRPLQVWATLIQEIQTGNLLFHVGMTLWRVVVSFVVAMLIGGALGLALGKSKLADKLFDSWLIFFLNLPALVIIILCYVWFGLTETAAILAVSINKIPNVAVTVREGARSLSRDLNEMAEVYRFGWWKTLRHVTLPQLAPFFAAAARSGLSLVWKIVLVVELLGRSNGVGFQLHMAFQLFDVSMILAYAVSFILVVQVIEMGILQPIEARVNRWRR